MSEGIGRAKSVTRIVSRVAVGAGAVVGASYIVSRIKEKQESESRLERLEQIVEGLVARPDE